MGDGTGSPPDTFTTSGLAAAAGYSVQQVRDLERIGALPPAVRKPNGYRRFAAEHLAALRAYRLLAIAVGPVVARSTMTDLRRLPYEEAVALVVELHTGLARSREDTIAALRALDRIADDAAEHRSATAADSMGITELASALGVRSSTLRFWEHEGLVTPERVGRLGTRAYPPGVIDDARIVAALRASGYPIPAVRAAMVSIRAAGGTDDARGTLSTRLHTLAARAEALLRAGSDLADLLAGRAAPTPGPADSPGGRA